MKNEKRIVVTLLLVAALTTLQPALQAQSTERWVGTWATALIGRPQMPPPPGPPAPAPFMRNACPAPPPAANPAQAPAGTTFGPAPFTHFTNQTLRQIVRASIGGPRVRVVLTNEFSSAAYTSGAVHNAIRDKEKAIATANALTVTFNGVPSVNFA